MPLLLLSSWALYGVCSCTQAVIHVHTYATVWRLRRCRLRRIQKRTLQKVQYVDDQWQPQPAITTRHHHGMYPALGNRWIPVPSRQKSILPVCPLQQSCEECYTHFCMLVRSLNKDKFILTIYKHDWCLHSKGNIGIPRLSLRRWTSGDLPAMTREARLICGAQLAADYRGALSEMDQR